MDTERKAVREALEFAKGEGYLYAMRVIEMKFGVQSTAYQALLYRWAGDHPPEPTK